MPQIPRTSLAREFNLPEVNPQIAGSVWGEVGKAGQRIEQVGEKGFNVYDLIQKAQDHIDALRYDNTAEILFSDASTTYDRRRDYKNFKISSEADATKIKEQLDVLIKDNPKLAKIHEVKFPLYTSKFFQKVRINQIKEMDADAQVEIEKKRDIVSNKISMSDSEETKSNLFNTFSKDIDILVDAHTISREFAYNQKMKLEKQGQSATIIRGINSDNPEVVKQTLEDMKSGKFNKLDEQAVATYVVSGNNKLEVLNKKIETAKNELIIDNARGDLQKWISDPMNPTPDEYDLIQGRLRTPQYQKEFNLDPKKTKYLQEYFSNERTHSEKVKESNQKKIQNDFITRLYSMDNPLTPDNVNRSGLEPTGDGSKAYFNKLIEDREKAFIEKRNLPYTTTNGKTLADILTRQNDPNKPPLSANEILSKTGSLDGISVNLAKSMIESSEVTKDETFKYTDSTLKVQFGYEGLILGFGNKQIGSVHYANTMTEILGELSQRPLKGSALKQKMFEIANTHLISYWQDIGENPEDIKSKLKVMGIKQSPSINLIPPSEPEKKPLPKSATSKIKEKSVYLQLSDEVKSDVVITILKEKQNGTPINMIKKQLEEAGINPNDFKVHLK